MSLKEILKFIFWIPREQEAAIPQPLHRTYMTHSGDEVKSKGEREIADFLTWQNIRFVYEPQISLNHHLVKPDFYLTDYNVYIEYFGMDDHEYQRKAALKRQAYKDNDLLLIPLYFKSKGSLGPVIKRMFEEVTGKPFPQTKYFDWRIKHRASNFHSYYHA
jgi:predicted nuclease of restriction endonuclease-like RecB superfamily